MIIFLIIPFPPLLFTIILDNKAIPFPLITVFLIASVLVQVHFLFKTTPLFNKSCSN